MYHCVLSIFPGPQYGALGAEIKLHCENSQQTCGQLSVSTGELSEQFLSNRCGFQQDDISICICYFSWRQTL